MKKRLIRYLSVLLVLVIAGFGFLLIREWTEIQQMKKDFEKDKKTFALDDEVKQTRQQRAELPPMSSEVASSTEPDAPAADTGNLRIEETAAPTDKGPDKTVDTATETTGKETEENRRKSLFGFGAYPDVPLGLFPHGKKVWDEIESLAEEDSRSARNVELMVRVRIKFWELGTETVGASMETGLIYPSIPNVAYVTYGTREMGDGETKRYIQSITGGGNLTAEEYDMVEAGITPPSWIILSHASGGIDPYTFLELE